MRDDFLGKNKGSFMLACVVMMFAAANMHPSFATLISLIVMGGLLGMLRWCAHLEGRARDDKGE
jgi:hypothetical protein